MNSSDEAALSAVFLQAVTIKNTEAINMPIWKLALQVVRW
jgi:hypothetical protein